jgi:hypothetical protein
MYPITYWLWYQPLSLFPLKIVSHLGELEPGMLGRHKRLYDAFGWVQSKSSNLGDGQVYQIWVTVSW